MKQFSPIQVVLDARTYQDVRVRTAGGGRKDFFADDDGGFIKHRSQIAGTLHAVAETLEAQKGAPIGFLKISMRQEALAKSHRPVKALFPSRATAIVGIDEVGELLVQISAGTAERAASLVEEAEDHVEMATKVDKNGNEILVPKPSQTRAETSAIGKIGLWGPNDKRRFSTKVAIGWAKERKLSLRYRIDLFDYVPPEDRKILNEIGDISPRNWFFEQLDQLLGGGYFAIYDRPSSEASERLYIWLVKDKSTKIITTRKQVLGTLPKISAIDLDEARHDKLLKFLDHSFLVRRITLPSSFQRSAGKMNATSATSLKHTYSLPVVNAEYPVVGIIDGGIGNTPDSWVQYQSSAIPPSHLDPSHGMEIASLLIDGQKLNHPAVCPEPDGCFLIDIAALPLVDFFSENYPGGDIEFLSALEVEVRKAKDATGARVFCFSHNVDYAVQQDTYDELSMGLDGIARRQDVIFVISAGNLKAGGYRPEWKTDPSQVLSDLANSLDDRVRAPADSLLNISVGALNSASLSHVHPSVPARYSRRGPGFKFTTKPDLTHFGGCGPTDTSNVTGLRAVTIGENTIWVHGTSYSGPLAAKTLARIDQLTSGALSREALIALLIHGSSMPSSIAAKEYASVRRDLVGFGLPKAAEALLEGKSNAATLVFLDVLQPKKDLFFRFRWPECLSNDGSCRGRARATLVYSPPIGEKFGAEMVRINLDVSLQQYDIKKNAFASQTDGVFKIGKGSDHLVENELIKDSLKWSNVKQVEFSSPRGVGKSSDWRLNVGYLERLDAVFPTEGIPFAVVVTIEDADESSPVYQDMRATLVSNSVRTEDIQIFGRTHVKN